MCPAARPTRTSRTIASSVPFPTRLTIAGHTRIRIGITPRTSTANAIVLIGPAARSANAGASFRTTIPTASGSRSDQKTSASTAAGRICRGMSRLRSISSSDRGMSSTASECRRHQESSHVGKPSALFEGLSGEGRRQGRERQGHQRNLYRGGRVECAGQDQRCDRHDHEHRHQRPSQLAGAAEEMGSVLQCGTKTQGEDQQREAGLEQEREQGCHAHVTPSRGLTASGSARRRRGRVQRQGPG